jgi:hypothetical protein
MSDARYFGEIRFSYAVTVDNFNGEPWPPDGDDLWSIVGRVDGFTKWRRLILQMPASISPPNDAGTLRVAKVKTKLGKEKQ